MIGRVWRAWAERANADTYAVIYHSEVRALLDGVSGFRGAYLMRREEGDAIEIVSLTLFDSLEAVRAFAGEEYETAFVLPQAQPLFRDYERTVRHYEIVAAPENDAS